MCDYPFFIPQVVLFANSSLFWFKVTNEHREFRNYLVQSSVIHLEDCYNSLILYYTHYTLLLSAFHSLAVYVLRHSNNNFPAYNRILSLCLILDTLKYKIYNFL